MPYKNREDRLKYLKEYQKSDRGILATKKFRESEKNRLYKYNYNRSPKMLEHRKKYYSENSERFKLARRERRNKTYDAMGGKCIKCGFSDYRALQIDHINGDGKSERPLLRRDDYYPNVLKSFLAGEGRYQLLCCNCNWIKREENGEYRKKIEETGQISH